MEFLARVMESQPAAPRVIISGFADRNAIIAAVNEVHLTRFIEKPGDDEVLRHAVVTILSGRGHGAAKPVAGDSMIERDDDGGIVIEHDGLGNFGD